MVTFVLRLWLFAPTLAFLMLTQADRPADDSTADDDARMADAIKDAADRLKEAAPVITAGGSGHTRKAATTADPDRSTKPSA